MPDIAVTKCVTSTVIRNEDSVLGDFFVKHKDFNSSGKHSNALLVVVVVFLVFTHKYTVFGPGTGRLHT